MTMHKQNGFISVGADYHSRRNRNHCARFPQSPRGFTLIELLVVVSIIALLVSILMPALGRARKQARRVVCASHIRQLAMAELTYVNEYGHLFPRYVQLADVEASSADIRYQADAATVLPFAMMTYTWEFMKSNLGVMGEFMFCPSMQIGAVEWEQYFTDDGDLVNRHDGSTYWPTPCVWTGYNHLGGLCNLSAADPMPDVKEAAHGPDDKPYKLLWCDGAFRHEGYEDSWETDWQSKVPHKGKDGLPEGSNNARLDGGVDWNPASQMAWDEDGNVTALTRTARGKYRHVPGSAADYYPRSYFW